MNWGMVALAYALAIVGGHIVARALVIYLKKSIDKTYTAYLSRLAPLDWSIGFVERSLAFILVIWAPTLAGTFVGGWIALKFAANWSKRDSGKDFAAQENIARHRLTGLLGSTVSLAIAVGAGLLAHPHSLTTWKN